MERSMTSRTVKQVGAAVFAALLAATTFTTSSHAWIRVGGCFACGGGAFVAGAAVGAAIARPYYPPRYVYPVPVYAPYPAYPPYAACPLIAPLPYYCR
jgi:hypothetical protein